MQLLLVAILALFSALSSQVCGASMRNSRVDKRQLVGGFSGSGASFGGGNFAGGGIRGGIIGNQFQSEFVSAPTVISNPRFQQTVATTAASEDESDEKNNASISNIVQVKAQKASTGNQMQTRSQYGNSVHPEDVSIYDYLGIRSMLPLYNSMFKELALWNNGVPDLGPSEVATTATPGEDNSGEENTISVPNMVQIKAQTASTENQMQTRSQYKNNVRPEEVSIYDYLGIRSMLPLYNAMFNELALWNNGVPALGPSTSGNAPTNQGELPGTYNNGYDNGWNGFGGGGLTGIGLGVPGFGGGGVSGVFGRRR